MQSIYKNLMKITILIIQCFIDILGFKLFDMLIINGSKYSLNNNCEQEC